jgi:replicative DNA helicase
MSDESILSDRLPPQAIEAERAVLGSMIRAGGKQENVIGDVIRIVRPESFYSDAHQKIYQAIIDLYDKGTPVDLVILAETLQQRGQFEDIGRASYLAELWDASPTSANAEYYARIVRDRAVTRDLIHVSNEILRDAYDQLQPADELLEASEKRILEIAQKGIIGQTVTLQDALGEAYDRIDQHNLGGHQTISGLSTGFIDLDEITAGFQNSELIILAARPSVGKTALSLSLVRNIIMNEAAAVFFVSLEQSRIELAERLLCAQACVDSHKLRKGHLSGDDMQKLIEAGGALRGAAQLFIDDSPGQGMLRIGANARRLKLRNNIRLVVIDYLQLIEPDNRRDPRQEQVAQISRRLKFLARELQIPVVALAQVNRSAEDRQDHRPRLADLRESGCLTGDTLITLPDTNRRVPIRELVGQSGLNVWALDDGTGELKRSEVSRAFSTGRKPVFRLQTRLGRAIRATANHKFRAIEGWKRLDSLREGDQIAVLEDEKATFLSNCGAYWDRITSIIPNGEDEVFDLTVPGPHNFLAGSIIAHNSIEQDADTVLMLHRPDRYEPGQNEGLVEVIVAKQRNGPTGEINLAYIKQFMRFENFQRVDPFSS